jgi:GntR family transcriptional regulator
MHLDKQSPIPLYYQLAEHLRAQIASGELKPGDQIPPERELCERAGISRMTARQAVTYLVQHGVLEAHMGKGTFVAAPKLAYDVHHLLGFTEKMIGEGVPSTSRVIEQALELPPANIALRLQLKPRGKALKLVRLRLAADVPHLLETIYVPASLCPGLEREDFSRHSLYVLLEQRYGLPLAHAEQTLEATTANDFEAPLFGLSKGAPMMLLEGVTFTTGNRPVEHFTAVYRADRFKFKIDSQRNDPKVPAARAVHTNGNGVTPVFRSVSLAK